MKIKEWVESNHLIINKWLGDKGFQIGEEKYMIVKPKSGFLFDSEFRIILSSDEKAYENLYDYYAFEFGNRWYYSPKDEIQLNDLRYVGQIDESNDMPFLGLHGCREVCNGSRSYKDWVRKAKFLGYKTLGISEKNTLAGTLKFQKECESKDIKSILGYTTAIKNGDHTDSVKLYVINEAGWINLLRIHKIATVDNDNYIDHDEILKLSEGLILVLNPEFKWSDRYEDFINNFVHVFYQFDITSFRSEEKDKRRLLSVKYYIDNYIDKVPPVLIWDAYYLDPEDFRIKKIFNSIIHNEFENESRDQYLKSRDEVSQQLRNLFKDRDTGDFVLSICIDNTIKISHICDYKIPTGVFHLPKYKMTDDEKLKYSSNEKMFWGLLEDGILSKFPDGMPGEYYDRVDYEFSVIKEGGFIDYFLITWDICKFSDENDIWRGLGRGSAPSSLILYIFNVTHIDPMEYNLPFERFLNPARIKNSLPDVDLDFETERREEIKEYVVGRYGRDQTCYIGNMGEFKIKSLMKDLAKEFEIPFPKINYISATIPNKIAMDMDFTGLFKYAQKSKPLKELIHEEPDMINYIPLGLGSYRSRGVHAAAVVIFPDERKVYEWIPVRKDENKDVLISEFDGYELDELGFLKEDVLGVNQIDKMKMMVNLTKVHLGVEVDEHKIPNDNKLTYLMFQEGHTQDIFQFNSPGMISFLRDMIPEVIHDLIAANALYRPGTMGSGMHNDYVNVKNGYRELTYDHPLLEPILKSTYGVYCYQEQILSIVQTLADFTLAESDIIRRSIGKKIMKLMVQYKNEFIERGINKGIQSDILEIIWDKIEKFAGYSFNQSHAACYAIMGYRAQWFKANYPVSFWTTSLQKLGDANKKTSDVLPYYLNEIGKTQKIMVVPPNINVSNYEFIPDYDGNKVYWNLSSIKFVGDVAVQSIIKARASGGNFFSMNDFCSRVDKSKVNKRTVTNLILSGCFDEVYNILEEKDRVEIIQAYHDVTKTKVPEEFFSEGSENNYWWTLKQKDLSGLGEVNYGDIVPEEIKSDFFDLSTFFSYDAVGNHVSIGGTVVEITERVSKNGKFANLILNHNSENIHVLLWSDCWMGDKMWSKDIKEAKEKGKIIFVSGKVSEDSYKKTNVLTSVSNKSKLKVL